MTILAERLQRAIDTLGGMASDPILTPVEAARLQGMVEGIKMALSCLEKRKQEVLQIDGGDGA